MALSKQEINNWLSSDNEKIILCDIEYHDGTALRMGHFSNYPYIMQHGDTFTWIFSDGTVDTIDSNISYLDNLISIPDIVSRIDSDSNVGSIEFLNAEGIYDHLITLAWEGHPLKMYIGDPSWPRKDFILIVNAISTGISSPRNNIMALGIRDKKEIFNRKIQDKIIYWNTEFDNYLSNLYFPTVPFTKDALNTRTYSTGIEVKVTDPNNTITDAELTKLTFDAIVGNPSFEANVAELDSPPDGTAQTSFTIQCALVGPAKEDAHAYTKTDGALADCNLAVTDFSNTNTGSSNEIIQVQNITVAKCPNNSYFGIYSPYENFYVWYNYNGAGIDPKKVEDDNPQPFMPFPQKSFIPETTLNTPVPICLGKCFNVSPVLIDEFNHVYQVHDGEITKFTEIRANGVPLSSVLYETNESIGCFRLLVHSSNTQITCDVVGTTQRQNYNNNITVKDHTVPWLIEWISINRANLDKYDIDELTFDYDSNSGLKTTAEVGLYITAETDIAPLITELTTSIGGFCRFNRLGKLEISQVIDPLIYKGAIKISIIEDNIVENGLSLSLTEPPKASITLGYRKNWTVQEKASLAGIVTTSDNLYLAELYSTEYSKVIAANKNIKDIYPLAEDTEVLPTLLYTVADAQAEVNRRKILRGSKRYVYKIEATAAPFTISIGSIIYVTHKRFGFSNTKKAIVIGLNEQPTKQRVDIEVWL